MDRWRKGERVKITGPNERDRGRQYIGYTGKVVEIRRDKVLVRMPGNNLAPTYFKKRNVERVK